MKNFAVESMISEFMTANRAIDHTLVSGADVAKTQAMPHYFKMNGGIHIGDIINFPTIDELDSRFVARPLLNGKYAVDLLCAVERDGKMLVVKINKDIVARTGYDMSGEMVFTNGLPSKDFMDGISIYDGFRNLCGRRVRVVSAVSINVRCIRRGAVKSDGRWLESDFEFAPRTFFTLEYLA